MASNLACLPVTMVIFMALAIVSFAGPQWKFVAKSKSAARAATDWVPSVLDTANADAILTDVFQEYKSFYTKKYANEDEGNRAFQNFKTSLRAVYNVNNDDSKTYWADLNQFSDMSFEDFRSKLLMQTQLSDNSSGPSSSDSPPANITAESSYYNRRSLLQADFDWRTYGKVTPVKDQGQCGCCYAFSAAGALESAYLIATGAQSADLSEEQLMNCANMAANGCNGGSSAQAIQYALSNNAVAEASYPYTARSSQCNQAAFNKMNAVRFSANSQVAFVSSNSRAAMMQAVRKTPVAIYWYADDKFQHYAGGIYSSSTCNQDPNHGMLAVGFSTSQNYWIIKNSWGTGWGEAGFIRVAMTGENTPGMCNMYTYGHYPQIGGVTQRLGSPPASPAPSSSSSSSPPRGGSSGGNNGGGNGNGGGNNNNNGGGGGGGGSCMQIPGFTFHSQKDVYFGTFIMVGAPTNLPTMATYCTGQFNCQCVGFSTSSRIHTWGTAADLHSWIPSFEPSGSAGQPCAGFYMRNSVPACHQG